MRSPQVLACCRVNEVTAIVMMIVGVGVALAWRQAGLHGMIYEGMPGMLAGLAVGLLMSAVMTPGKAASFAQSSSSIGRTSTR